MRIKGIRILDKKNGIVLVELPDIFKEIQNGNSFFWSILYLYATGNLGNSQSIPDFEQQINKSENGFQITWDDLNLLFHKFYDVMDITIIGCEDKSLLKRYKSDQEIRKACDIVISMIDSSYWEIFSKNEDLIEKIASTFKQVEFIT